jgi:hypothetical protein
MRRKLTFVDEYKLNGLSAAVLEPLFRNLDLEHQTLQRIIHHNTV